jgi:hypothetical protein
MTGTQKPPKIKDATKKIVSLTLDPVLVARIDEYAANKKISRSAAIEVAITGLLALNSSLSLTAAENSVVLPDDCIFATPSFGGAIFY